MTIDRPPATVAPLRPRRPCPECGQPVRKMISRTNIGSAAPSDRQLAEKGFTKLVRKDKGVYENVTAGKGEGRTYTLPDD